MERFVDVAVQLPLPSTFAYKVPARLGDRELVGQRVLVPFGRRGVSGVVVGHLERAPEGVKGIRELTAVLDRDPMVLPPVLELCRWISEYYEAAPGESLKAALPPGTAITANQLVRCTEEGSAALGGGALPKAWRDLLSFLDNKGEAVPQRELTKLRVKSADIAKLVEQGWLAYELEANEAKIRDKSVRTARLTGALDEEMRAALARAPKKLALVETLAAADGPVRVDELKENHPRATEHLRGLKEKGLVEMGEEVVRGDAWDKQADRVEGMVAPAQAFALNEGQQWALDQMSEALDEGVFASYLLHGITGSGKTEVYLQLIDACLSQGKKAIVLVPEISLTPQLAARFRARFGERVAVLHSALTLRERYDEWHRLREGQAVIALGARSAIFAPIDELGVVVVDEEHDSSFKQEEGVRYNARDVALVRAQKAGAVCVLGSATPSLESYQGSISGRLERLPLSERATGRPLPSVELVDLRRYQPDKESMLTKPLADAIEECLHRKEQCILFLNRRGFDTFVMCTACGHAFRCKHCSVSLTYHRFRERMVCHYCSHEEALPGECPSCEASESISRRGFGTEKITDAVAARFPQARVERLDRDVASGAGVQKILGRVARGEVDILVGTQMVTKGHDFPGVTLVGVLCADTGLSLPDFRASEKTFKLLTQVAGRAGRGDKSGRVLIQSYRVENLAISASAQHDFEAFAKGELADRRDLGYPPFGHLVAIRVDGPNSGQVIRASRQLADIARKVSDEVAVLGPAEAPLARLKGRTRWHLWLRAPERGALRRTVRTVMAQAELPGGVRVAVDVDPVSAL